MSEWVTNLNLLVLGQEHLLELVVDASLDVDSRTGAASLSVVEVDTKASPRDGVFQVGIVKDDVGGLATELQGSLLQVGRSSSLENVSADQGGTGEGDLVNVHVSTDGRSSDGAKSRDDVDDTIGETRVLEEFGELQGRQRSLLGSLEDDGVTSGNSRSDLPSHHEEGEVPRDDLTTDTNGFVSSVGQLGSINFNDLTMVLVGPALTEGRCSKGGSSNSALVYISPVTIQHRLLTP